MEVCGTQRNCAGVLDLNMKVGRRWQDAVVTWSVGQGIADDFANIDAAELMEEEHRYKRSGRMSRVPIETWRHRAYSDLHNALYVFISDGKGEIIFWTGRCLSITRAYLGCTIDILISRTTMRSRAD